MTSAMQEAVMDCGMLIGTVLMFLGCNVRVWSGVVLSAKAVGAAGVAISAGCLVFAVARCLMAPSSGF